MMRGPGCAVGESGPSGGGGISAYESQPSYQHGVVTQTSTQRANPDVAYAADPATPFAVFDSYGLAGWQAGGGTSAGAPQWSALIALADQARGMAGKGPLDGPTQTLPALYKSVPASDFHDITTGNNGYAAGPGFDLVTGIGTPKANLIVPALVAQANTPQVSSPKPAPTTVSASPTTKPASPPAAAKPATTTILSSDSSQALTVPPPSLFSQATPTIQFSYTVSAAVATPAAAPIVSNLPFGVVTPPSTQSTNAFIGSGGGDNAVISGDGVLDELPSVPPLLDLDSDSSDGPMAVSPIAPATDRQLPAATWRDRCTAYFADDRQTDGSRNQYRPTTTAAVGDSRVLADPIATLAGLVLVLGSYWSRRPEESNPHRRKLQAQIT